MAETLARAGLHLGTTTVGRILKEKPAPSPEVVEGTDSDDRVLFQIPESPLDCGPHGHPDRCRILVLLAPLTLPR